MMKRRIDYNSNMVGVNYSNWLTQLIMMLKAKNTYIVGGRGLAKTSDIMAQKLKAVCEEMPGCYIALSGDTYMNLRKNVLPSLFEGWRRSGWLDDIHFSADKRPPDHFDKAYKPPLEWKNTVNVHLGNHFKLISMDRPSTGAGDSFQFLAADEIKFQSEKKLNKLTPAIRGGDIRYRTSPYYGGRLYTTDMPNINHGEHDFILNLEKNMNHKQMALIFQLAEVLNDYVIQMYQAQEKNDQRAYDLAKRNHDRWGKEYNELRKNSTFFYTASSYVNAEILPQDFFKDAVETTSFRDVMTSIFSFQPGIEKGQMFYSNFTNRHISRKSFNYERLESISLTEEIEECSLDLEYIDHDAPLEAGFDSGNMCSLVVGQEQGAFQRILKFLYTLPEGERTGFIDGLGKWFRDYFANHRRKELFLYHDRATNNFRAVGDDHASRLKRAIEYDDNGASTGWFVTLMNVGQATITHQEEHDLMLEIFAEKNKQLPKVRINGETCKPLKSSLELSEKIIKVNRHGQKSIHKNKTSEKTNNWEKLLNFSTNPSDAFKYYMCRPEYLNILSSSSSGFVIIGN